jgi:iron complex transport system substrate-binding protein
MILTNLLINLVKGAMMGEHYDRLLTRAPLFRVIVLWGGITLLSSCNIGSPQGSALQGSAPVASPSSATPATAKSCTKPDQTVSFEPVTLTHAKGFNIEYHDRYKVITVSNPWTNSKQSFQYLLVQCGTPIPPGFDQAQVVTIPIEKVVVLSTTHLPFFDRLNALDRIKGIRQIQEVSNPKLRQQFDRGEVVAVGNGTDLDFERIVSLQPDLVTTFGIANVETTSIQRLQDLGLPTAVIAEYLEADPLAQAEWIKFIAAFLNQEKEANTIFNAIVQDYNHLRSLTQNLEKRPTVLTGFDLNGTWYVAGGKSFIAQFIQDAGGTYLWGDNTNTGNLALDFEAVFLKGSQAEIWINTNTNWQTILDVTQEDDRYGEFKALKTNYIFNNDAQLNPDGGNDYWESGILNPQVVLADLIKIIHPDLLPDHTLFYYRKLLPSPSHSIPSPSNASPNDREASSP